ncbi:MAG: hypothetical protein ACF8R7_15285 [Phycisphaerales bacterium JB039]
MRLLLGVASLLSLGIGVPLIVFSDYSDRFFLWPVDPALSAAFLGACYVAGGVFELVAARARTWTEARIAVPGVVIFAIITLIVTLLSFEQINLLSPGAAPWIIVYIAYPGAAAMLWRRQARQGRAGPSSGDLPRALRLGLAGAGALLVLYGAVLLLAPGPAGALWPWDPSPPGAYAGMAGMEPYFGAWLVGLGAVAIHGARENDRRRLRPLFAGALALGAALGLLLPRSAGVIDWERPSAWIFTAAIAGLLGLGAWGLLQRRAA